LLFATSGGRLIVEARFDIDSAATDEVGEPG
jgi:hypothetical protein